MSAQTPPTLREYATDEIVVEWRPGLCYHSQNCIRALPAVFDRERRPWVSVDAATADEIDDAVAQCPSGALSARRAGVGAAARATAKVQVRASAGGPLLVSGPVKIVDGDGNVLLEADKAALCRCGQSANKPFCDGTHKTVGFAG